MSAGRLAGVCRSRRVRILAFLAAAYFDGPFLLVKEADTIAWREAASASTRGVTA